MWAYLDLVWKPSATEPTPPAGKGSAIIRGDTESRTIRVTDGTLNGYDAWDWSAQIRAQRLTGATAGDPLVSYTVTLEPDGDDLLVHLLLAPNETLTLPNAAFWDLQLTDGTTVTTWLSGKVKVLDDVTRASA